MPIVRRWIRDSFKAIFRVRWHIKCGEIEEGMGHPIKNTFSHSLGRGGGVPTLTERKRTRKGEKGRLAMF